MIDAIITFSIRHRALVIAASAGCAHPHDRLPAPPSPATLPFAEAEGAAQVCVVRPETLAEYAFPDGAAWWNTSTQKVEEELA